MRLISGVVEDRNRTAEANHPKHERLNVREVLMAFLHDVNDRYFEDYVEGDVHNFGTVEVEVDEIISFARRYDPQPIHTDPDVAKLKPFGGIIASGWHTVGLMMRLYVEYYLSNVASLVSPGIDDLRWHKPVRPGDRLSVRVTIAKTVASKSKPDRGIVTSLVEVYNQHSELVMSLTAMNIILKRKTA